MRPERLLFVAAGAGIAALQWLDPGVGAIEKPLSSYALGEYSGVWLIAILCASAGMFLGARRWRATEPRGHGPTFLYISGFAFLGVALFVTDPWYPWQRMPTWTGWIHVLSTGAGMGALALAMLFDLRERREGGRSSRAFALMYVVVLAGVLVATLAFIVAGADPPLIGLEERVLFALALLWLVRSVCPEPTVPEIGWRREEGTQRG